MATEELEITELGDEGENEPPCPPPSTAGGDPTARYNLEGPQVEYEAAFWLVNAKLTMPTIRQIVDKLGDKLKPYSTDQTVLNDEINELKELARNRREKDKLDQNEVSAFLHLQKQPFGAVFNTTYDQYRVSDVTKQHERIGLSRVVVQNGGELARLFENETPGLYHRHALNWLLYNRADFSPVRHARIWAALDLTIYAALAAAWHFKWAYGEGISFRQRPWEYDHSLNVLFDRIVNMEGSGNDSFKTEPCPTPGTPRHPAYPSGHSTYSAAASHILNYFFRGASDDPATKYTIDIPTELTKLANNIGEARLWAGVHWRSDHTFGQDVGKAVAELIIDQLEQDCIPTLPSYQPTPPTSDELQEAEEARSKRCPDGANHDSIPPRQDTNREKNAF